MSPPLPTEFFAQGPPPKHHDRLSTAQLHLSLLPNPPLFTTSQTPPISTRYARRSSAGLADFHIICSTRPAPFSFLSTASLAIRQLVLTLDFWRSNTPLVYTVPLGPTSSFSTTTEAKMAEQQTPTFKLVLVGDGGTGKV